ncbi:Alpha/Beta hydrolase protein [Lasiosphaeria hispida]|uniref:Alpha/Beta hydrolase protein n=1 Tax=Lasiosphaeria hispida TaxID=260671 RepID=A0AAJ0HQW3_9PEZI|nr:Alpha/Beta hydrolase protein [Lasiosphaeria hispida]
MAKVSFQPLHPSIRDKLDPEYVELHDAKVQYIQPLELDTSWTPESRSRPSALAFAVQRTVDVGKVYDQDVEDFQIRVFVPAGDAPVEGWPCLVWYHGGGWVNGGLDSENGFLAHACKYVQCVVVTVNYRHAPEHPYPAAIKDAFRGFEWATSPENAETLSIDTSRLAIGGTSAGGGLAASVGLKILKDSDQTTIPKPCFQLLICPVIDNTATTESAWSTAKHSPFLTPGRMEWYRQKYFQGTDGSERMNWEASPCFAPTELLGGSPDSFIGIAECDLLAPEAIKYAATLEGLGARVESRVYPGATHSILALAGIHKVGKYLVHDACDALARHLGTSYDREVAIVEGLSE